MGKRRTNYLPSRGLRLLPYQQDIVEQTMEVEGLTRSGAMRFLMMLGAHAVKQEDRMGDRLDKIDRELIVISDTLRDIKDNL